MTVVKALRIEFGSLETNMGEMMRIPLSWYGRSTRVNYPAALDIKNVYCGFKMPTTTEHHNAVGYCCRAMVQQREPNRSVSRDRREYWLPADLLAAPPWHASPPIGAAQCAPCSGVEARRAKRNEAWGWRMRTHDNAYHSH